MNAMMIQSLSIFGAGVLTSLTPCVYPLIPITVGYLGANSGKEKSKNKIFGFFLGQVLAFTLLGVVAVSLGEIFGFSSELPQVQLLTGAVLIFFAYYSFKGELPGFLNKWNNSNLMGSKNINFKKSPWISFLQAFLVGSVTALVASPCTSPVLGGVLTTIAGAGSLAVGAFLMFLYSVGLSLIFLVLGLGLMNINKLPKSGKWLNAVHKISAVLLLGAGSYFIYNGILNFVR